ncbi:MAG: ABC transporter ATP-binding protein [Clostridia bacterium]|nr:ABC transporter ATP-binding protein [Clostridia bacterium]MBR4458613.1 ABC transporter ATP-binding protein [Clostridia bacterium]
MRLLDVKNLRTIFHIGVGNVDAVRGISFHVDKGEFLGIVGESGSGKSVTMLSVMGLLPEYASREADQILFDGTELTALTPRQMRGVQGKEIGMVFQDPMTSLNPLYTVGQQIEEPLRIHLGLKKAEARQRALELLDRVEIPDPKTRLKQYPHELSGGMRQRVMIAIAIACEPKMIIADEPTTALDVTIQAQILELLDHLKKNSGSSVVMITHDLGVIASMCTRIIVMYGGLICEEGSAREIFYRPKHPYTWGLLNSVPQIELHKHKKLIPIPGTPPDMISPPAGCPFAPRCRHCMQICRMMPPPETVLPDGHRVFCHLMHPNAPKVEREVNA